MSFKGLLLVLLACSASACVRPCLNTCLASNAQPNCYASCGCLPFGSNPTFGGLVTTEDGRNFTIQVIPYSDEEYVEDTFDCDLKCGEICFRFTTGWNTINCVEYCGCGAFITEVLPEQPVAPVDPVTPAPVQPVTPAPEPAPSAPAEPVTPATPAEPAPSAPAEPVVPVAPAEPAPSAPAEPVTPATPAEPAPSAPAEPVVPDTPAEPIPSTPAEPVVPVTPTPTQIPEVAPTTPVVDQTPAQPANPQDTQPVPTQPAVPTATDPTTPVTPAVPAASVPDQAATPVPTPAPTIEEPAPIGATQAFANSCLARCAEMCNSSSSTTCFEECSSGFCPETTSTSSLLFSFVFSAIVLIGLALGIYFMVGRTSKRGRQPLADMQVSYISL